MLGRAVKWQRVLRSVLGYESQRSPYAEGNKHLYSDGFSNCMLLNAGEEKMYTVVLPGRDKVQRGLLSCFPRAALRDVFILLSCLHSPCTETARALGSSFYWLLV